MSVLWLLSLVVLCHSTEAQQENSSLEASSRTQQVINQTAPAAEARGKRSLLDPEKRAGQKLRFSSWAGKRSDEPEEEKRAKFSSWGGKRSDEDYSTNVFEGINDLKRAKFSSWGGKRDYMDDGEEKRAKFSSWAGKRFVDEQTEDKRSKFNSWAGKRAEDSSEDKRAKFSSWAGKRGKFNSWAGKRSERPIEDDISAEGKRAKFSSWAGKRSPDYLGTSWNKMTPDNRLKYYSNGVGEAGSENIMKLWHDLMSRKRARFSSWAGKRSDEGVLEREGLERALEYGEGSGWGGESTVVKRSAPGPAYKRKPVFSSWGGKRAEHTVEPRSTLRSGARAPRPWATLMRPIRRQPEFYAWGGKRAA